MSGIFDQVINYAPPSLLKGTVTYKGTWSAATNTPTLSNPPSAITNGNYYVVSAGGTQFSLVFNIGDWIISNGTAWEKVDNTDAVSSVFGRTGAVVGVSTDYSVVGITNTALGASNPSTVAATTVTASSTIAATGAVTGSNLSGTNTGDQTIALTGGVTGSGTGSFAATVVTNANLTGVITSSGNATSIASQTGTGTKFVVDTSPVLITPNLGTPTAAVLTSATGLPLTTGVTGTLPVANGGTGVTTSTGTTNVVLSGSPTITTPVIAQINDASGNETLKLASIASAVNEVTIENAATGNAVHISATGGDASVGLHLAGKGASGYVNVQDSTDATKRIMFNAAGGTTNTRTMLSSTQTVDRTLSLPDATDTLVGRATTDTLTNKTLTSPTLTTPALGTPASGTVTNLTGTASININGTVGATTAAAGSFTTVSATGASTFTNSAPSVIGGLGFRNRIISGDMRIDQRNEGAAKTIDNGGGNYALDRWQGSAAGGGIFTLQRNTTTPDGFTNSMVATVTTADASIAAADYYTIQHYIEGYNVADLGLGTATAKTFTVSFLARSSVTGSYTATVMSSDGQRAYRTLFSVSSANTWTKYTIVLPGDTSGTWYTDNRAGLLFFISLGSGATFTGATGAWSAGNYIFTGTGQTNWISTLSATFYLTGVQLEVGNAATEFERRPFGQELALCQRYFEKSASETRAILTANESSAVIITAATSIVTNSYYARVSFVVSKRTAPTVTCYPYTTPTNTGRLSSDTGVDYGASSAVTGSTNWGFTILNASGGTLTVGSQKLILGGWYADGEI